MKEIVPPGLARGHRAAPTVARLAATADFTALAARDIAVLGLAGGLAYGLYAGPRGALSLLSGSLWVALNFTLLAWLLEAALAQGGRRFVFTLACAKIPASYFVLYWLYTVDFLEPVGLSIGLAALPVALVVRGLARAGGEGGAPDLAGSP